MRLKNRHFLHCCVPRQQGSQRKKERSGHEGQTNQYNKSATSGEGFGLHIPHCHESLGEGRRFRSRRGRRAGRERTSCLACEGQHFPPDPRGNEEARFIGETVHLHSQRREPPLLRFLEQSLTARISRALGQIRFGVVPWNPALGQRVAEPERAWPHGSHQAPQGSSSYGDPSPVRWLSPPANFRCPSGTEDNAKSCARPLVLPSQESRGRLIGAGRVPAQVGPRHSVPPKWARMWSVPACPAFDEQHHSPPGFS